jgi:hypothetical protein
MVNNELNRDFHKVARPYRIKSADAAVAIAALREALGA